MTHESDPSHEEILESLVRHLLSSDDLDELCAEAGIPVLIDNDGQPVYLREAVTYDNAGVMTLNHGVVVRLSDRSEFQLTIVTSRRPDSSVRVRTPDTAG